MIDPRWEIFPETVLDVRAPGLPVLEIDLRREPPPGLGRELARRGLTGDFAVVTACNPAGEPIDAEANLRRDAMLAGRLEELGIDLIRVDGRSPDGSHNEPGYGVPLTLDAARSLAREFRQTAIFWWDGESFWLIEAVESGRVLRLP